MLIILNEVSGIARLRYYSEFLISIKLPQVCPYFYIKN